MLTPRSLALPRVALVVVACLLTAPRAMGQQTLRIDASGGGLRFDGVGAVSGGGATSVLLKDYPEPQRSQILDVLFKPQFAASMQTLYVEIGSDGNATQGTEPTHMRSRTDENYDRGYEWWIMREAKNRNPDLTLDACAWGAPGWVGGGNFWSQDMADYDVKWVKGLKSEHGLDLDAIGCRNERGDAAAWAKLFRKTLDANGLNRVRLHGFDNPGSAWAWKWVPQLETDKELAAAIDVVGNHTLTLVEPQPPSVRKTLDELHKPLWNTEEHVYDGEGRRYADEFDAALGMVNLFNRNYIYQRATKVVNWYLVGSTYGIEPYADQPPAMFARSPWSGNYSLKPVIWSYAHYGQFTKIGWTYVDAGCAALADGGTVVTLRSDAGDYSVIAETGGATRPQTIAVNVGPGLSTKPLCVWRTMRDEQFVRLDDVTPGHGAFTITLAPGAIYSLSTTTGQRKGTFPDVPAAKPFPFPYRDDFDHYGDPKQWGYLPHYTADICGVFEVIDRPDHGGKCLGQVVSEKAQSWAPEWQPYTVLGDETWKDYDVSADVFLDDGGWAGLMTRVNATGNGWDGNPNGYYVRLYPDGGVTLYAADQKLRGPHERQLAVGAARRWQWSRWHNLKLRAQGKALTVLVDGQEALSAPANDFDHGMAGLITAGEGNARHKAYFDNLTIAPVGSETPAVTAFPQDGSPIYAK